MPKPPWGRAAVPEVVQIGLNGFQGQAFLEGLFGEHFVAMFALSSGGDLKSASEKIKALGQAGIVLVQHVIEGTDGEGPVLDEDKVIAVFLLDVFTQGAFGTGVKVTFFFSGGSL